MTSTLNSTSSSRAISARRRDPFLALANEIERNPFWVDSLGEWELPPEENRRQRTPAEAARQPRRPSIRAMVKQAEKATGKPVTAITLPDGTRLDFEREQPRQGNELDQWIAKHADKTQRH
jgi:hypothetical protein